MSRYILHGRAGWGSVLAEAQLEWYGLPFDFVDVGDLFEDPTARRELAKINPLGQVPALILPDGEVMTETAAITLHLADAAGSHELVPAPHDANRPRFLRWLIFIVTNIYPTFTYGDVPDASFRAPRLRKASAPMSMNTKSSCGAWSSPRRRRRGSWANGFRLSISISAP